MFRRKFHLIALLPSTKPSAASLDNYNDEFGFCSLRFFREISFIMMPNVYHH